MMPDFDAIKNADVDACGKWAMLVISNPIMAVELVQKAQLPNDHPAVQVLAEAYARGLV